jgi:hypothetical protein
MEPTALSRTGSPEPSVYFRENSQIQFSSQGLAAVRRDACSTRADLGECLVLEHLRPGIQYALGDLKADDGLSVK